MHHPTPVSEWHAVGADTFERIITLGRPAVLRGLVRDWPATQAGVVSPRTISDYIKGFHVGHA